MKSDLFYFFKCDIESLQHILQLLLQHNITEDECLNLGMMDEDGVPHDVVSVPGYLVAQLLRAKELDDSKKIHQFTLYVSDFQDGPLRPYVKHEEVKQPKPKPSTQSLRDQIKSIVARRLRRGI